MAGLTYTTGDLPAAQLRRWPIAAWLQFFALVALGALVAAGVGAQPVSRPVVAEHQVKAAYLAKFGSYVEWPAYAYPEARSPIRIGIIGDDLLADALAQLVSGRTVNGRQVMVQKLRYGDALAGLGILFIGRSSNERLADILALTRGAPTLTVTESDQALVLGSMINFVTIDGRVRFEVAPDAASLGNLSISARLLAAARKVVSGGA